MTKSRAFLFFCLSFIIGLSLGSIVSVPQLAMLGFLIAGIFLISIFWDNRKAVVVGLSLLFFVFGIGRLQRLNKKYSSPIFLR